MLFFTSFGKAEQVQVDPREEFDGYCRVTGDGITEGLEVIVNVLGGEVIGGVDVKVVNKLKHPMN